MTDLSKPSQITSQARVLVVDADAQARVSTTLALKRLGCHIEETASGRDALAMLERMSYDLLMLDMMLPGIGGLEVMQRARCVRSDLLIIVLTATATVESAIAAVKANVVDYMVKPCQADDLIVTISRSLEERARQMRHQRLLDMVGEAMDALRQPPTNAAPAPLVQQTALAPSVSGRDLMMAGALVLDREKRQVTLKTNPPRTVELTEGEVSILIALMEKPNQVFSYNELAKVALGYDGMDKWTIESVIRSSVFRLRHKIEVGPGAPCLIRTVRGRGYFFSPA